MPSNIKNERQYEALKDKGMSKERTAQKKEAGRKGGKATARKNRS